MSSALVTLVRSPAALLLLALLATVAAAVVYLVATSITI